MRRALLLGGEPPGILPRGHSSCPVLTGGGPAAGDGSPRLRPGSQEPLSDAASLPAFRLAKTFATAECRLATAAGMSRYSLDPSGPAFSHRGSVPPASALYCKRQNSGDGPLGGGPATGGPRTSPLSSGGPSASGLRPPGCSPKRNGTSLEGNRCGNVMHAWAPCDFPPGPGGTTADGGGGDPGCLNVGTLGNQKFS